LLKELRKVLESTIFVSKLAVSDLFLIRLVEVFGLGYGPMRRLDGDVELIALLAMP
jgi:hypothetical protein